ncbi:MAG: cation-transporting P-type ATPase, partial [Akkermansia sp.]
MPSFKARAAGCVPLKTPVITPENIPPRFSHRLQSGKKHLNHENAAHYQGLTEKQVLENRDKYGVNILTPPEKEPLWKQFLEKFSDPIIKILLVALVLSVGVACYQFFSGAEPASVFLEPVGILVAILLATCVGFAFEVSANKKFEILNQVNDDTMVQAIRGGNICEIPRRDVVVGDVVVLNTGEEVPADGVLLDAVSL